LIDCLTQIRTRDRLTRHDQPRRHRGRLIIDPYGAELSRIFPCMGMVNGLGQVSV
jgi:hypothetical protein